MKVDYSKYKTLKVELKEKIATITLNRPELLNAIGGEAHEELVEVFHDVDVDPEVYACIITGAGRAFSAGGDVKMMKEMLTNPSIMPLMSEPKALIRNIIQLRKPIIAAVNGPATGLGADLALYCDIIYMAENARIGDPHVTVGLVAGDGGAVIWPLQIPLCRAKEFLMTGELVKAPDAERIGLINKCVPAEELMDTAWAMAKRFADGAIQAISWTKVCLNKILEERVNLILDASLAYEYHSFKLPDHAEAVDAFIEKRSPKFKGGQI
jgi:enoyl-CoA hydratase